MEKFQVTEPSTGPLISTYSRIREGGGECFVTDLPKIRLLSFSAQKIRGGWEDRGGEAGRTKGSPGKHMGPVKSSFP